VNLRLLALSAVLGWFGGTLLLSRVRWFARPPLVVRVRPYLGGAPGRGHAAERTTLSAATFRDVMGPLARDLGARMSRILGVSEEMSTRLRRSHSPLDVTDVRLRQLGWASASLAAGVLLAQAIPLPLVGAAVVVLGGPLLAFLVIEQQVATASNRWQDRLFLELPVVTEQLGMLLSAGYSLGAALGRLAMRGQGACQTDLQQVCLRIQQGLSELDALREWSDQADVPEVRRLVDVLALNREAGDLGRLISEEARSNRREVQRRTLEVIERRSQQVWIPVTVATLVPGVLFISVPFIEAMRLFSSG
jgi:Flp pilus assembly protein TadB